MSKTQAFALLLLVLPIVLATASPVLAATWQEVETWVDYINQQKEWQEVETWTDWLNTILIIGSPVLISPYNDNTIYDNTPTFHWYTGANAANHRFVLDNDEAFSSPVENIQLGGTTTTYTITTPLADDNYWWKVIATGGDLENSSEVWTFELLTPVAKEWYDVEIWRDFICVSIAMSGSGTADDPYIITTVEQLQTMQNNLAAYYILGNGIDASATSGWNDNAGFVPVGESEGNSFMGTFDGRGYVIENLYINRPNTTHVGLFGCVGSGGVVANIGVENENVTGKYRTGGLIGYNEGTVSNSYVTGEVSGLSYVGGLVALNGGMVSNCHSAGSVYNGASYTGGLIGFIYSGTVSNSYSNSTVVTPSGHIGGLVGYISSGVVSNCYSTGSVSGDHHAGGLVGWSEGMVENSYSTGSVSGNDNVGGLVGYNEGTVSNSFWDNETSGQSSSDGGTGKTTENMKTVRTFTDVAWSVGLDDPWDFVDDPYDDVGVTDIWDIDEVTNDGYPYLCEALPGWAEVETWECSLDMGEWVEPPPGLSTEDVWILFVLRILFIFGPLGFIAWEFTKIRDPEAGLRAAGKVAICFIAIIVLWIVADAIQVVLASV